MIKKEIVEKALSSIKQKVDYEYFFSKIQSPEWIEPLLEKGFFKQPPESVIDGNLISFPIWPESQYLVRMAAKDPEVVYKVINKLSDDHDNPRVFCDLVDAAILMPPKISVQLLERAKNWTKSNYKLLLPEKVGALISHYANGGFMGEALELARTLMDIFPDSKEDYKSEFDLWTYKLILDRDFFVLFEIDSIKTIGLLCELLNKSFQNQKNEEDDEDTDDTSYIWRPAIEDHPQNFDHSAKEILVVKIRDFSEKFIERSDNVSISLIFNVFKNYKNKIFQRIKIHLLRISRGKNIQLIKDEIINRKNFDDVSFHHEYSLLLSECFTCLSDDEKNIIWEWIVFEPDVDKIKNDIEKWSGDKISNDEAIKIHEQRQLKYLAWIHKHLQGVRKLYYDKLLSAYGEPDHPEFFSYGTSSVGPTSPKTADEMKEMTVADITSFLKIWKAPEDKLHMEPSPEGLGRVLSTVIKDNPYKFADDAVKFIGLDPTYIRSFISGLEEAVKSKITFNWPEVLKLCLWVVEQPREIAGRSTERTMFDDPHWGWARKSVASLISEGLKHDEHFPVDLCEILLNILRVVSSDPDPAEKEIKNGYEAHSVAINSTRGEAIEAIIQLALWLHNNIDKFSKEYDNLKNNVFEILEFHLDPQKDPSPAIRSIYGAWFPWLLLTNHEWAVNKAAEIFSGKAPFSNVAWDTYIRYCPPYDNVFDVLKCQYSQAVEHLSEEMDKDDKIIHERLAEHLMAYYWRGKLTLDDQSLFEKFWKNASLDIRRYSIEHVGRCLHNDKKEIPAIIIERLKSLWEWRLNKTSHEKQLKTDKMIGELDGFGWWFVSDKFDPDWSLQNLMSVLKNTRKIAPEHLVAKKLVEYCDKMPDETLDCLEFIIKNNKDPWGIYHWDKSARIILEKTIKTDLSAKARDIINFLGSCGHKEFRDLLK